MLDARCYLRLVYLTGPEQGTHDFIGPFNQPQDAIAHRRDFGPVKAEVVTLETEPYPLMAPEAHIAHTER